jgi:D-alanyl-D-alanine carboxypeptidase
MASADPRNAATPEPPNSTADARNLGTTEPRTSDPRQSPEPRVDRDHALPSDYVPDDLVVVGPGFEKRRVYQLRLEAAAAWERMRDAARADGIQLRLVSAFRSYQDQQRVYQAKVERDGPQQNAVAAPGHSEHQLGTAIDIAGPDDETMLEHAFAETDAGKWLVARAPEFGYAVRYTRANQKQTGYTAEPWHYRYFGDAARARHDAALQGK